MRRIICYARPSCLTPYGGLPTYCDWADTSWYALDRVRQPDRRKPPKQAKLPDAPGRPGQTRNEQVSGSSPLVGSPFIAICRKNAEQRNGPSFTSGPIYCNPSDGGALHSAGGVITDT